MEREAQLFVEVLANRLAGIAQLHETTSYLINAVLVWGRSITLAIVTREPL